VLWQIAHAWETTSCGSVGRRAVSPHPSAGLALVWAVGCDSNSAAPADCIREWNAPTNASNRTVVAQDGRGWRVVVERWRSAPTGSSAAVAPLAEDLGAQGCSFFFYTHGRVRTRLTRPDSSGRRTGRKRRPTTSTRSSLASSPQRPATASSRLTGAPSKANTRMCE